MVVLQTEATAAVPSAEAEIRWIGKREHNTGGMADQCPQGYLQHSTRSFGFTRICNTGERRPQQAFREDSAHQEDGSDIRATGINNHIDFNYTYSNITLITDTLLPFLIRKTCTGFGHGGHFDGSAVD